MAATYAILPHACVGCHACVRVCPTDAVVVTGDEVRIDEALCIACGLCAPACQHDAIAVEGDRRVAETLAGEGAAVLLLDPEAEVFFHPATHEQVVNACRAVGFRQVYSSALGDELVAGEYLRLWTQMDGRTVIRSTCPITVDYIRHRYPALLEALAPVTTPVEAAARYLRAAYRPREVRIVYAGPAGKAAPGGNGSVDAAVTLQDLRGMFESRGIRVENQARTLNWLPQERRRFLSVPGGLPLPLLAGERLNTVRVRKVRGLGGVAAVARALAEGDALGFVDLTAWDGGLAHPSMGPTEELFLRRRLAATREPGRAGRPVVDDRVRVDLSARYEAADGEARRATPDLVERILEEIGTGPDGRPWDCGACGYPTCRAFATAAAVDRATLRMCPPAQERRAERLARDAAYDALTGLHTYRVFQERLAAEAARVRRTGGALSLIMVDLDGFKEVNDRFGHQVGNTVLQAVGDVIGRTVRKSDFAARFGGDEFVILLPDTAEGGAKIVAEKVRQGLLEIETPSEPPPPVRISGSLGIASARGRKEEDLDPAAFFETADRALYQAKQAGGNTIVSTPTS